MMTTLLFPFDPATTARIRETGKTLRVLQTARKWYSRDPQKFEMQIRLCDRRIEDALVELSHIEAVLDSIEASTKQDAVDTVRSGS